MHKVSLKTKTRRVNTISQIMTQSRYKGEKMETIYLSFFFLQHTCNGHINNKSCLALTLEHFWPFGENNCSNMILELFTGNISSFGMQAALTVQITFHNSKQELLLWQQSFNNRSAILDVLKNLC